MTLRTVTTKLPSDHSLSHSVSGGSLFGVLIDGVNTLCADAQFVTLFFSLLIISANSNILDFVKFSSFLLWRDNHHMASGRAFL